MPEQKNTYAIVLIGAMNPRIHHPAWYQTVGLLDKDEAEAAMKLPLTLTTPMLAQLQTPKLLINCQDNRWEIRTVELDQVQRIQDITCKVFDELLVHTPIAAAGFNFTTYNETACKDVGMYLSAAAVKSGIGLKGDNAVAAELTLRRRFDDHTSLVIVQPVADNPRAVLITQNFEYPIQGEGFFKLADVFTRRYADDRSQADDQTALIVAAINQVSKD